MRYRVEGNFARVRALAEWCLANGVDVSFLIQMVDRPLEDDETCSPIYHRHISLEDAAAGVIQHTATEEVRTRILGPLLMFVADDDLELFHLRFRGIYEYEPE